MDLSVLALSVVKQGDEEIPGLTDKVLPKRLGPKRATKIRKFFGLGKDDDVSASPHSYDTNHSTYSVAVSGAVAVSDDRVVADRWSEQLGPQIRHSP